MVFLLIKSFFLAILFALIFSFIFKKLYNYLLKKTKNPNLSASIVSVMVILILLIPVYFIVLSLIDQTTYIIHSSETLLLNFEKQDCSVKLCEVIKQNIDFSNINVKEYFNRISNYFYGTYSDIFNSITKILVNFSIFILAFYFLLVDGDSFLKYIKRVIPLKKDHKDALFYRFREVSSAVFAGSLLVAEIQGILLGIGFFIFGLPSPIFWAIVTTFFALIPVIGTAIVWVPVVIYFFLTAQYVQAVLFLFWGVVLVGLSDNILRPYFIKRKIEVHPFLVLISILGGIEVFGFLGIFIGPIIISLLISLLHLYHLNFS